MEMQCLLQVLSMDSEYDFNDYFMQFIIISFIDVHYHFNIDDEFVGCTQYSSLAVDLIFHFRPV